MASIYDKASLVLIPSGTKTSKVYSQKPTNGDGDFTFSRSTAATRVNASGNIEKETQNLLLQSNQFDTTWGTFGTPTLTSGQSGYDGTNDAWLFQNNGSDYIRQDASYGVSTFSIYAKANTGDFIYLFSDGVGGRYFNLNSGTLGTEVLSGLIESKIESVGNGWYRCIVVVPTFSRIRMYASLTQGDTSSVANIYIQDAQLEQGLVARDYIETTTTAIYGGITDNVPRLDYTDSSCPALLLEPQRTNALANSEYFGDWNKNSGTTLTANNAISPDGNQNATLVECPLTGGRVGYDIALTSGTTYTFSVYLKNNGGNTSIDIGSYGTSQLETITINNDWNRYSTTFTATSTTTSNIRFVSSGSNINMYAFGAQLEQGSYATSYIPTYGSAVTRNNDGQNLQLDGVKTNGFFGDSYSIYFEFDNLSFGGAAGNFNYLYDTSNATCMYVYGSTLSINTTSGEQYTNFTQGFTDASQGKFLVIYDGSSVKIFKDGSLYRTYNNPSSRWDNPKFYRLSLSAATATISYKSFMTFPTALTDQEAIDLTTI